MLRVAGVVVVVDGKLLLVQEGMGEARGLWNFPAGHIDEGETAEQAAIREACEETGFETRIVSHVGSFKHPKLDIVRDLFEAEIIGGKLDWPKEEILEARFFDNNELLELKTDNKFRSIDLLNIVLNKYFIKFIT